MSMEAYQLEVQKQLLRESISGLLGFKAACAIEIQRIADDLLDTITGLNITQEDEDIVTAAMDDALYQFNMASANLAYAKAQLAALE
jgi:hypothetical protein